nr:hypothetical protein [Gemmatimonadota bacterium]
VGASGPSFCTPRSLVLGGLVCFALLAAGCADHAPPLEPTPTGALLAGQGQGPQNPAVVVIDVDHEDEIPGFCAGFGDFPDGFAVLNHAKGRVRVMLLRHPISGALRQIHVFQGLNLTSTGNDRSVSGNTAGARAGATSAEAERAEAARRLGERFRARGLLPGREAAREGAPR